jgi:hypothetical protein
MTDTGTDPDVVRDVCWLLDSRCSPRRAAICGARSGRSAPGANDGVLDCATNPRSPRGFARTSGTPYGDWAAF